MNKVRHVEMTEMCLRLKTQVGRARLWLRSIAGDAGSELVEAGLILPLLLTFLLGIFSFGRAYNVYQTITRGAREGARALVLTNCATCGNAPYAASFVRSNFVDTTLQSAYLDPSKVSNYAAKFVWLDPGASPPQECGVAISLDYPYQFIVPWTSVSLTTVNLSTRVQMRLENQPSSCPVGSDVP